MTPEETPPEQPNGASAPHERHEGPAVQLPVQRRPEREKKNAGYGIVKATKATAKHQLHVTVWPEGAGEPYPVAVEPDDQGWFYLDKKHQGSKYRIRPGTVLHEEGRYKAWVKEGYYETLDPRDLGKGPHPDFVNNLIRAEVLSELEGMTRRPMSGWQKAGIISGSILALAVIGILVWGIISIGGDLAGIKNALEGLDFSRLGAGSAGDPGTGHQNIAPEG